MEPMELILAQTAATALTLAAARDEWPSVRTEFLAIFDEDERGDVAAALRLDTLAEVIRDTPAESRDEIVAELIPAWEARLRLLVSADPQVVGRLRGFVEGILRRMGGARGVGSVQATVVQQSVAVYNVLGGDIHVYGAGRDIHRSS